MYEQSVYEQITQWMVHSVSQFRLYCKFGSTSLFKLDIHTVIKFRKGFAFSLNCAADKKVESPFTNTSDTEKRLYHTTNEKFLYSKYID